MDKENLVITYLFFHFQQKESLVSALLSVNHRGFPLDFRFSSGNQANAIQTALYGQCLENYMIEAVTKELLSNFQLEPDIVFTNYRYPFESELIPFPLICLKKKADSTLSTQILTEEPKFKMEELEENIVFEINEPFTRISKALNLLKDKI